MFWLRMPGPVTPLRPSTRRCAARPSLSLSLAHLSPFRLSCSDYRPMEHLDRYEGDGIDDGYVDDVTEEERFAARLAAERELAERDVVEGRLTGRRRGLPAALEGASVGLGSTWAPVFRAPLVRRWCSKSQSCMHACALACPRQSLSAASAHLPTPCSGSPSRGAGR